MELFIEEESLGRFTKVYGYEKRGEIDDIIGFDGNSLVYTSVSRNEIIPEGTPYLLHMHTLKFRELVKALMIYADKNGIEKENENLLKGKLEATEEHLKTVKIHYEGLTATLTSIIHKLK